VRLEEDAVGKVSRGNRRGGVLPAVGPGAAHGDTARAERLRGGAGEAPRPRRPRVVGEVDGDVGVVPPCHLPGLLAAGGRHPHRGPAAEVGSAQAGVVVGDGAEGGMGHDRAPSLGSHRQVAPRRRRDARIVERRAVDSAVRVAKVLVPGRAAVDAHACEHVARATAREVHPVDVERPVVHREEGELARGERARSVGAEDLRARACRGLDAFDGRERLGGRGEAVHPGLDGDRRERGAVAKERDEDRALADDHVGVAAGDDADEAAGDDADDPHRYEAAAAVRAGVLVHLVCTAVDVVDQHGDLAGEVHSADAYYRA